MSDLTSRGNMLTSTMGCMNIASVKKNHATNREGAINNWEGAIKHMLSCWCCACTDLLASVKEIILTFYFYLVFACSSCSKNRSLSPFNINPAHHQGRKGWERTQISTQVAYIFINHRQKQNRAKNHKNKKACLAGYLIW